MTRRWNPGGYVHRRISPWVRGILFWRRLTPPTLFVWSFVLLIAIGTAGLLLIPGLQIGPKLSFIESLFTMTSAACVTGMMVVDTSSHFTPAGQAWILLFIQLGGLGLITLTSLLIGALGKQLSLRSEMLSMVQVRRTDRTEVWQLALRVAKFSLIVEGIGALLLFGLWLPDMPAPEAAWHAVFHAINAYCNAGLSTFSTSLSEMSSSPLTLIVVSMLVIIGGLGYYTFEELVRWWRTAQRRRQGLRIDIRSTHRLSSHSWAVLVTSAVLLLAGWILFAVFEWHGTLGSMSPGDKLANAWFLSATPRSAGFANVDYSMVGNDTAALTMMLMLVGGSPGSTAGGLKTTTIAVLVALGLSRMRGKRFVGIKSRAIPAETIERTIGIILLAMLVLVTSFFLLCAIEGSGLTAETSRAQFLPLAFETVSAFSTVGLSMNLTPELAGSSKLILVGLMFIGRVGLLSFFTAIALRRSQPPAYLRPAQEDVIVG
ncbi:MAG: TrkH family potassium uptake protein [Kofleriaceae bacterium]